MVRSAAKKVMWVGRATVFLVGLAVILGLVFGVASAALGANGQPWILGQGNVATAITSLGGAQGVDGPMVRLTNNDAGSDDTALSLNVQSGEAPMTVDSSTKVANLNADRLDGLDSSTFLRGRQVVQKTVSAPPNLPDYLSSTHVVANCPSGKFALGGGYNQGTVNEKVVIAYSRPTSDGRGWELWVHNETTHNINATAYVICATAFSFPFPPSNTKLSK